MVSCRDATRLSIERNYIATLTVPAWIIDGPMMNTSGGATRGRLLRNSVGRFECAGNDTLNTGGAIAELVTTSGRRVQLAAFDTVHPRSVNGATNRRVSLSAIQYVLQLHGTWV